MHTATEICNRPNRHDDCVFLGKLQRITQHQHPPTTCPQVRAPLQYFGPPLEEKLARAKPQSRSLSSGPPICASCQSSPSPHRCVPPVPPGLQVPRLHDGTWPASSTVQAWHFAHNTTHTPSLTASPNLLARESTPESESVQPRPFRYSANRRDIITHLYNHQTL